MALKKINTQYWEENKWHHDCSLYYSDSKGLYSSKNTFPLSTGIIYQSHGYKGYHHDIIEVNGLKIKIDSNFGYDNRSYLRASVEMNGQRLLDFDTSKLFILHNCSIATFDVKPYEWNTLFDKIIVATNNFIPKFFSKQSIAYTEKLREILNSDSVKIKGTFMNEKEYVWNGDFIVTLLVADKITDLINGFRLSQVNDKITIEYTLKLCREFLAKLRIIDADITDSRTKRLSDTLFLIHEFMYENDCGLDFFSAFVGEKKKMMTCEHSFR
jgi:hypothetical protein